MPEENPNPAVEWPADELDMPLRKPVTVAGETVTSLKLREPTCAEWEDCLAQPSIKQRRHIVSTVSGIPAGIVATMGIGDVTRAEEYLMRFFEVGQRIDA